MNTFDFQVKTHAKCVIAGEHSVLRNCTALVFSFKQKFLLLNYQNTNSVLTLKEDSEYFDFRVRVFKKYLLYGIKLLNKKPSDLRGNFFLKNNIHAGGGLGFSAVMCVAIAKWFCWKDWLNKEELFSFAHQLEKQFHGKSSGIDIAGVLYDQPILFSAKNGIQTAEINWYPNLYISDTSSNSTTKKCIKKVENLIKKNPDLGRNIDLEMAFAVAEAVEALKLSRDNGIALLAQAITRAANCFKQWQLITLEMQQQMDFLLAQGALAVKPTGSGGGGCILSLWKTSPPTLPFELIPIN